MLLISGVALPIVAVLNTAAQNVALPQTVTLILEAAVSSIFLYMALIVGHLLGRFYWRYRERLNWEV